MGIAADAGDAEAVRAAVNGTGGRLRPSGHPGEQRRGGPSGPIEQLTVDEFDRSVAVNIRFVSVATQEALRHMGDGGRITSIGSVLAERRPFPNGTPYSLTKAVIGGFTRAPGWEPGPRAIAGNNVSPARSTPAATQPTVTSPR